MHLRVCTQWTGWLRATVHQLLLARLRKSVTAATDDAGDAEDLIGEEAKLGIRKPARPRGVLARPEQAKHTTRSNVSADVPIPTPPFLRIACR
jgi:hypothetical protein